MPNLADLLSTAIEGSDLPRHLLLVVQLTARYSGLPQLAFMLDLTNAALSSAVRVSLCHLTSAIVAELIRTRLKSTVDPMIRIDLRHREGEIILQVSDNGRSSCSSEHMTFRLDPQAGLCAASLGAVISRHASFNRDGPLTLSFLTRPISRCEQGIS